MATLELAPSVGAAIRRHGEQTYPHECCGALLGAAEIGFVSLNQGLTMRFSDPAYHGRMQSLLMMGFAFFGIIAFPLGFLADAIGIRETLFLQGAVATALLAVILVYARVSKAASDARLPVAQLPDAAD